MQITKMFSAEGEEVPFKQTLYPRGNVEDWLLEVERVMMESLRQIMEEALKDYKEVSLTTLKSSTNSLILFKIYFEFSFFRSARVQTGFSNGQVRLSLLAARHTGQPKSQTLSK